MQALTARDTTKNLADDQAPEVMKVNYLEHCFNSAKEDLANGNVVDDEYFLNDL